MDLVASSLFEEYNNQFKEVIWKGIYREDGLLVFEGKKSLSEIKRRRDDFQSAANKLSGNEYLQFTCELWRPNTRPSKNKQDEVSEITTQAFPYLDFEFFWNDGRELEFQVHRKTNKKLKYPNKLSTHTKATCNAIPSSIFNRLAKLTSRTEKKAQMKIDK